MAPNGQANGVNGHPPRPYARFSDTPALINIPLRGDDVDEVVPIPTDELSDATDELCDLLINEGVATSIWITVALAYAKQAKIDLAIDVLQKGLDALARSRSEDRLSILACMCWLYLHKCRQAPRIKPTLPTADDRTKDHWLHAATSTLNDASRINPSYPPLFLARGTLYLLRASLYPPKSQPGSQSDVERANTLKNAAKCFDDAYKASQGQNMMAILGKAKAQYSLGRYPEALSLYQQALERAPDMVDPDPRIGIGCCLWHLGHKEHAKTAWQRSLELNADSKIANALLGVYFFDDSYSYKLGSEEWQPVYIKAMTTFTQTAFGLDKFYGLTCATFGHYFLARKQFDRVAKLATRAVERTDVNATASDGWYLRARMEHYKGNLALAAEYYGKADQARGGDEKGYLPAKFGAAQLKTLMQDFDGAKFRLEKILSSATNAAGGKSLDAMTLLGILHAEDVFANQAAGNKEDKSVEQKKAIGLLEQVRVAWKDPKRKASPDAAVLSNLARLYELEQPEKALICLKEVEQNELKEIAATDATPPDHKSEHDVEELRAKRRLLSPQLLNNIGCFHFQAERFSQARDDFQTALDATVGMQERDHEIDTDPLVTTICYNLARAYEAQGMNEEALDSYKGLLARHPDYTDANARMAYITLTTNPSEGAEAIKQLIESDPSNLEVRSLYGWYTNRHKKRTHQLNEDAEQRHYKHTLQNFDKHDLYSLTGMGNLHLAVAREMRRETDQDKEKRSKTYMRAVEFFDKVLTLDPRNAFAAQGLGIAVVEDKRDTAAGIQIFSKVRESLKGMSGSVNINLGHVFAETRQWSRSIENYELALGKSAREREGQGPDAQILACLGRVWLMRGRQEKKLDAYKMSLDYSKQAVEQSVGENVNFRFNVAFVQIQLAQLLISLPEAQRTLTEVEAAAKGLDEAIEAFTEIAKGPNPPFPRGDLDARANMGRNTMKRQLAGALERQSEYERKNATRLEDARKRREEEIRKREEEKRVVAEKAEEQRRLIREQREKMAEEDRELISRRLGEDRAKEEAEYTTDAETGERRKREKRPRERRPKRKKKGEESEGDEDGIVGEGTDVEGGGRKSGRSRGTSGTPGSGSEGEGAPRRKKKRKLERKGQAVKAAGKYKSAERVEESEDEGAEAAGTADDEEAVGAVRASQRKKKVARVVEEDEDEEEGSGEVDVAGVDQGTTSAGDENHG
ncbi:hypothetical protein LTR08_004369 [Meristemomyces frigidus]|nr:hypothetical protein LTR08_004369 [Meristemomyces frigidus]